MITPEQAQQLLAEVNEKHHFKLHLGTNLSCLKNLAEALDIMSEASFRHHVTKEKNDFAQWTNDIVGDKGLAQRMYKLKSQKKMLKVLNKRIAFLEKKAAEAQFPSAAYLKSGVVDFSLGAIVGIIIGLIIAVIF